MSDNDRMVSCVDKLLRMEPFDASWEPGCGRPKPFGNFVRDWLFRTYSTYLSHGPEWIIRRRNANSTSGLSSGPSRYVHVEGVGQVCKRDAPFGMFPNDTQA